MRTLVTARTTYVWLFASGLTILAWGSATFGSGDRLTASTAEAVGVLAIAGIKAHLVIDEFMEVRAAPTWLRRATKGWLAGLCATILIMYLS